MEATQCELAQVHGPRMTGTSLASASSAGKLAVGNQLQSQPASMRSPQPRTLRVQEERTREPPPPDSLWWYLGIVERVGLSTELHVIAKLTFL